MTPVCTPTSRPAASLPWLLAIGLALLLAGCEWFLEEEQFHPAPDDGRPWILVDLYHTHIQNPVDYRLHRDQYNYQGTYGFHRLFEHFETYDYPWTSLRTMPLSAPRLEGFDVLFINLLHDRNPDFTQKEVDLIISFVESGGGLFVIADHTNVYRHAERINPFLIPMGIEVMYHTAVDYPPEHSISGRGWLMSFDFADHPVTEGLEMISFKTGGPLDTDYGVAFTSERSFADYWNEENTSGYYGNWTQGDDHDLEPSGPLSIVAAAEFGDGRVAVVGDQNIFGDAWINFGNNFELATNIVEWLAGNEDATEPLRLQKRKGHNIAFESRTNFFQAARTPKDGYYNFFIESNRNEEITARATPLLETHNTDTLFFPSSDITFRASASHLNDLEFDEEELDQIYHFLHDGGQVVISFEANDIRRPTEQLLERLTDDFEIRSGEVSWKPGDSESFDPGVWEGFFPITSTNFFIDDLLLGSLETFPNPADPADDEADGPFYPEDYEDLEGYLFDLEVSWGLPFIDAQKSGTQSTTIARHSLVGAGELIIFVQDGFFRNRTLGTDELLRPQASFRIDTIEFQHRFLDYLRSTARMMSK